MLLSGGEEAGNVGEIVLAVGVNLQGVAVALLRDPMDAVFDRGTFAAIMRAFEEGNGGVVRRESATLEPSSMTRTGNPCARKAVQTVARVAPWL